MERERGVWGCWRAAEAHIGDPLHELPCVGVGAGWEEVRGKHRQQIPTQLDRDGLEKITITKQSYEVVFDASGIIEH